MKRFLVLFLLTAGIFLSFCRPAPSSDNSLLPPSAAFDAEGAPVAHMKSLDQVEPRRLIASLPVVITNPGSYYVSANLVGETNQNGITIDADNVDLDLNGFSLIGSTNNPLEANATLHGILIDDDPIHTKITIRNGVIHNWGLNGIRGILAVDCSILGVYVTYNGDSVNYDGIAAGAGWILSDCVLRFNGGSGITTTGSTIIRRSIARQNDLHGMNVSSESRITDCHVSYNKMDGIRAGTDSMIRDCTIISNTSNGLNVADGCVIMNNLCANNGNAGTGAGILAGSQCRIESNHLRKNQYGIQITGLNEKSLVINNSAVQSTFMDYDLTANTHYGKIMTNSVLRAGFILTNPAANFSLY